ncbi:hypothetical protein DFR58_10841 [Anaerobacterium chartisolvens]|uniref:Uncharacterized protein n=1 Tax=Anaerobacterium chartisolvens TaxID=1297424 RepID=A0A369B980_9FIRM|nr:hypothetical protein [Anaerobacterium chartisolvens]RCX17148.1 hypothetical protein DFR58_10841 [Anaerobacterium chartisolvens]
MEHQSLLSYDTASLKKQIADNSKKIDEYLKQLIVITGGRLSDIPEADC